MRSTEQYDNIKASLRRLFEPGSVNEVALPSEEKQQRGLNVVQAMHGAPLTDLDGHPLDTGVDDHDEEQSTDAEYAAFQYARNRQQFKPQKPATPPDDGLSEEGR